MSGLRPPSSPPIEEITVDYESPEIIASYEESELTAEAAVAMQYGIQVDVIR